MRFESPSAPEQKSPEHPRAKAGLKALLWMGALLSVTGAMEHGAEAGPHHKSKKQEKKEKAEAFRYEGTLMTLPRAEDLDIEKEWRQEMPDGKVVTVYEGTNLLSADDVAEERVLDVHVMDDPDSNVKGDERWTECQVIIKTYVDKTLPKDYGYLCLDSAGDRKASGLHMDSPVGAFDFNGPKDADWEKMGAAPKTAEDRTLYELNNLYWSMKGLKEVGADRSDAAQYLAKEFRGKVAEAQSNKKTKPIDESILKEVLP